MLTGGALKAAIRNGLPDRIIELMSYWDLNTPKTTWQALRKAGKSYEAAEQAKEVAHKWGAASSSSSGKKEDNNNKPPCNDSNNNRKSERATKPSTCCLVFYFMSVEKLSQIYFL